MPVHNVNLLNRNGKILKCGSRLLWHSNCSETGESVLMPAVVIQTYRSLSGAIVKQQMNERLKKKE
jgi:hypothetical protein